MTDLFTEVQTNEVSDDKDYLAELVGENKKFRDVQSLAKGKATSDAYITQLETEMAELRNELKTRATVEDIFTKMNSKPDISVPDTNPDEPDGTLTPEAIDALVQKALAKTTAAQREAANFELVTSELQKIHGPNFQSRLNARLTELGMDKDVATNLAKTQPKAFLSLFGEAGASAPPASPKGSVNTAGFNPGSNVRGATYYDKLRQEMGSAKFFADTKLQRQRWQDIQTLGHEKFISS